MGDTRRGVDEPRDQRVRPGERAAGLRDEQRGHEEASVAQLDDAHLAQFVGAADAEAPGHQVVEVGGIEAEVAVVALGGAR